MPLTHSKQILVHFLVQREEPLPILGANAIALSFDHPLQLEPMARGRSPGRFCDGSTLNRLAQKLAVAHRGEADGGDPRADLWKHTYQTLVGDTEGSTPVRVGIQTSPPGYATPIHSHPYMEILTILEGRLHNEPGDELQIAADEQRKITALRLTRLLTS